MRRLRVLLTLSAALAAPIQAHAATPGAPVIHVLSSRADLVSSGDALVAIRLPAGARRARVTVGKRNVTRAFWRSGRQLTGLVTGLELGRNVLTALLPDGAGARLVLTDHPNGGPLIAGPQSNPWQCEPGATNALCDKPAQFSYVYKSTDDSK